MFGRNHSDHTKALIREKVSKAVFCPQTQTVYPSQCAAARELGLKQGDIANVLGGRQTTTKGFTFSFYIDQ